LFDLAADDAAGGKFEDNILAGNKGYIEFFRTAHAIKIKAQSFLIRNDWGFFQLFKTSG
jgi:hypothetical protein